MGAIFRKEILTWELVTQKLRSVRKKRQAEAAEDVDSQLFFILFIIFFLFFQEKVDEEEKVIVEPQLLLTFFLIFFFSQQNVVGSERNNGSLSENNDKTEIMKHGILCALRAGDKESLFKRISNDEMCIPRLVDNQGNSILHLAAALGHIHIVKSIVSNFRDDLLHKKNLMGENSLHVAARSGNLRVLKPLVECKEGRFLISEKSNNGDTSLHVALKGNHVELASFLVNERHHVSFRKNNDGVSPLYLAVEAGYYELVVKMLECSCCPSKSASMLSGKSIVHAAMRVKKRDILGIVLSQDPRLVNLRDKEGRTCLSLGASIGFYEGVSYILQEFDKTASSQLCYLTDDDGFTAIHMAAKEGHLRIIKEFLKHCPDSIELLNGQCQNILHVAAENGKSKVVKYIIGLDKQKRLMNEQDVDGNTPLHLATKNWHSEVVSILTWNNGVNLKTLNNNGFTALDNAEKLKNNDYVLRRRLTWMALVSAGAPNAPTLMISSHGYIRSKCEYTEKFKDRVNTLMVIATLVATVTFAAGFTLPGGFISSSPHLGMAVLVKKTSFKVFLMCNSIAMFSAMVTIMALIWAQLGDVVLIHKAFRVALPLLATALVSMSIAFMAGVCLVISHLPWLAYFILALDSVFLLALLLLIIPYVFSYPCQGFRRYIFYFPFFLMLLAISDEEDINNNSG